MRSVPLMLGASVVCALALGSGAGYFLARKQLETKYAEIARKEIEEAKTFYAKANKTGDFETIDKAFESLHPDMIDPEAVKLAVAATALTNYQGIATKTIKPTKVDDTTVKEIVSNVFANRREKDFSPEAFEREVRNRTEEAPYVITQAEFMANEQDYAQLSFTWYAGDGVLTDERDDRIDDIDVMVGENNLVRFGDWSEDPRIVYVRNHEKELEIEIALHDGKYSEVVAGISGGD